MHREFWNAKRVFLTGHTGFKGSWFALWLQSLGADLTGYSLPPPTTPSLFDVAGVGRGMRSITGDVRDLDGLTGAIRHARPDVLFHFAAQTVVRASYNDPVETYATNVMGTVNVLEAVRRLESPCTVVIVTSDKCYENRNWPWGYRECDPMGGHDPYSNSKGCAELVVSAYRTSFFSRKGSVYVGSGRAGNVIGGGDWTRDQLMADIMRAFTRGEPVRIRNPHAVRPWQFVLEPLRGYLTLAEHLSTGRAEFADGWNFGPHDEDARPVSWLVGRVAAMWGDGARSESDSGVHPPEDHMLKLDISKARSGLGWTPRVRLATALEWVVEWYKGFQRGEDARELTEVQIARYEDLSLNHQRTKQEIIL